MKLLHFFCWRGFKLVFLDIGKKTSPPVVLLHGFCSSLKINWFFPGWIKFLHDSGFRVIALDILGHGDSDKPVDPSPYNLALMASDVVDLLDYLGVRTAHIMGYSMGARIGVSMALFFPCHVRSLILGGVGSGLYDPKVIDWQPVIDSFLLPSLQDVRHPLGIMFRKFAQHINTQNNLIALASCLSMICKLFYFQDMQRIDVPTLIAVGSKDEVSGSPEALDSLMPCSRFLDIRGRDHMLAVGDKIFKQGALDFLIKSHKNLVDGLV
ncbi:alpha/beta hydrolase [Liberibacter crescens]|nr:alpha/beta hydrolase [Liberibacter crescens]